MKDLLKVVKFPRNSNLVVMGYGQQIFLVILLLSFLFFIFFFITCFGGWALILYPDGHFCKFACLNICMARLNASLATSVVNIPPEIFLWITICAIEHNNH